MVFCFDTNFNFHVRHNHLTFMYKICLRFKVFTTQKHVSMWKKNVFDTRSASLESRGNNLIYEKDANSRQSFLTQ